jgi:peptide/nickel transport system permease protein
MASKANTGTAGHSRTRSSLGPCRRLVRDWGGQLIDSPATVVALLLAFGFCAMAAFAPLLAPHDTSDVGTLDLMQAFRPPVWVEGGDWAYLLGTDDQGRDVLSGILFGARTSLLVSGFAVLLATLLGTVVGLFCGWVGGRPDAVLMRIAEVQLSFPAILIVLLIDGLGRTMLSADLHNVAAIPVLIVAIALSNWVQIARTVRGSAMTEKSKEYVQAARVIGIHPAAILLHHILPNIFAPVLVIATLGIAGAILTEATLSFLGVGVPPTQPSLGTLIRFGNNFLISGEWWMTVFPGLALVLLALSVNIVGDWLRDVLNPKLL